MTARKKQMFTNTFKDCVGLTGEIPQNLFGTLIGDAAESMFAATFSGCTNLESFTFLFDGSQLTGAPAKQMFQSTFNNCTKLNSEIKYGLFGAMRGAPGSVSSMISPMTSAKCL